MLLKSLVFDARDVEDDEAFDRAATGVGLCRASWFVVDAAEVLAMLGLRTGARMGGWAVAVAIDCRFVAAIEALGAGLGAMTLDGRDFVTTGALGLAVCLAAG